MRSSESTKSPATSTRRRRSPPVLASPLPLGAAVVAGCLNLDAVRDQLFDRARREGCGALDRRDRASIAGIVGHVVELLFAQIGWAPICQHAGPGPHGVT